LISEERDSSFSLSGASSVGRPSPPQIRVRVRVETRVEA